MVMMDDDLFISIFENGWTPKSNKWLQLPHWHCHPWTPMKLNPVHFIVFSTMLLISPVTPSRVLQDHDDHVEHLEENLPALEYTLQSASGCALVCFSLHQYPGRPLRWPPNKHALTYAFLPANNLADPVKAAFRRAFARWEAVAPLAFSESASYPEADVKIGFFEGDHGDGMPFGGRWGAALAHAFLPPDGRIHMNGAEEWAVEGLGGWSATAVDMESVAVHEIGHVLGLGHSAEAAAVMFPTIRPGERKVELTEDDVEGIRALYGGGGAVVAPPERIDGGCGCVGLWVCIVGELLLVVLIFVVCIFMENGRVIQFGSRERTSGCWPLFNIFRFMRTKTSTNDG